MYPKIATIVPKNHLKLVDGDSYLMALSHCAGDADYCHFFREQSRKGGTVILDNSAVETGAPESFDAYLEKAEAMLAKVVMLPDFFQDPLTTLEAAKANIVKVNRQLGPAVDVMVIPQGNTIGMWLANCYDLTAVLREYGRKALIGMSCRYTDMFRGSRVPMALTVLSVMRYPVFIHFLGCYADPRIEVSPMLANPFFCGVDSSYAAVFAQNHMELSVESLGWPRPPRNIDFLKDTYNEGLLTNNIDVWRKSCREGLLLTA